MWCEQTVLLPVRLVEQGWEHQAAGCRLSTTVAAQWHACLHHAHLRQGMVPCWQLQGGKHSCLVRHGSGFHRLHGEWFHVNLGSPGDGR